MKIKESLPSTETTASIIKKTRKLIYNNLNEKKITDNKTFWKTVKSFLSDQTPSEEKNNLD